MKKLAVILAAVVLALAIPSAAFAWDGQVHKGDLALFVGAGFGYGFTIVPGVEYAFVDFKLGDVFPLALGGVLKGSLNFYPSYWTAYGVGALLSAHVGFKGLDIPAFLQKFDVYASAGVAFSHFSWSGSLAGWDTGKDNYFGFATADGVAYYFNDKWAIYAEGNYWAYGGGATLGGRYTF
jgi:opacity protein-like surface antigen